MIACEIGDVDIWCRFLAIGILLYLLMYHVTMRSSTCVRLYMNKRVQRWGRRSLGSYCKVNDSRSICSNVMCFVKTVCRNDTYIIAGGWVWCVHNGGMQVTDCEQSERILLRNLMGFGAAQNRIKNYVRRNGRFIVKLVIIGSFLIYVEFLITSSILPL
jgi:hypothetical protein